MKRLREFWQSGHPAAEVPLRSWFRNAELSTWRSFADIKQTFNATDKVGESYVFDIGGNKWRIVASVSFEYSRVLVRWVGSHADYEKLNVSQV